MGTTLDEDYEICRRLNAEHGKTYYLATLLLPAPKRRYVHALYGFARYADNIVDDLDHTLTAEERARRFRSWSSVFLRDLASGNSSDPVCSAVIDTIRRWDIPRDYFEQFLHSMAMDLIVVEYETFDELARYMWGSASVIGLQMLPILGRADDGVDAAELERAAAALGIAFQLTNFIRDVGEDLRLGRIYLPRESLMRFDVDRDRLARGHVDDAVRSLLAFEVARARDFYRCAESGVRLVHPTSQDCLWTAISLYRGILDEIEKADYDIFSRRIAVPRRRRANRYARGLVGSWSARTRSATV